MTTNDRRPTILSLPLEVLNAVAEEIYFSPWSFETRLTISACSLVCKALLTSFRPLVFRTVDVNDYRDTGLLRRLAAVLLYNQDLGAHIQRMRLVLQKGRSTWDEDLLVVARRAVNLRELAFYHPLDVRDDVSWNLLSSSLQNAFTSFLTSPSLVSLEFTGNIIFAVPHAVLLSSPLETIEIAVHGEQPPHEMAHWRSMDNAWQESNPGGQPRAGAGLQCKSLSLNLELRKHGWLPYTLESRPTYFSHLTELELCRVVQDDLPCVQAVIHVADARLQKLNVHFQGPVRGDSDPVLLDLSRNMGLRTLDLHYEADAESQDDSPDLSRHCLLHDGLQSALIPTLDSLVAPSLRRIEIFADWECLGGLQSLGNRFPDACLRELDACFARLSQRQPSFKTLHLDVTMDYPDSDIDASNEHGPYGNGTDDDRTAARERIFPFLARSEPGELEVRFASDLGIDR